MAQTKNIFLINNGLNHVLDVKCAVGTYTFGDVIGFDNADGTHKLMSAIKTLTAAGICQEASPKVISTAGNTVRIQAGIVGPLSSSASAPPTDADLGRVLYASTFGASFSVTKTASTNPQVGRLFELDSVGNAFVIMDNRLIPSGTVNPV